jgi:hypothetical protein
MMNLNVDEVDYYDLRDRWLSDKIFLSCCVCDLGIKEYPTLLD